MNKKVWLITGCSKGLGRALVQKLLEQGYPVAATSRSQESLKQQFGEESSLFYPIAMDVTDEGQVKETVAKVLKKFGRIDVLVNNAGYTHLAAIEETDNAAAHALFEVNVFGLLNMIRAVLPGMRAQKSGHIFNVSSLGAYNVGALSGLYCATKHAVKAISETLALEVKEFGIHVTDVKPGFMRTEFFGSSYQTTLKEKSSYQKLYQENMAFYLGQNGRQAGDPQKAAELYLKVAEMENPPESLPMGTDSCDGIRQIAVNTAALMDQMRPLAQTTDF